MVGSSDATVAPSPGQVIAHGEVASGAPVVGRLRRAFSVADILTLAAESLEDTILWTQHASVTSIVPILPDVRGVICEGGGVTSHIAIVSRQFGLACVVAARFEPGAEAAEGHTVAIQPEGSIVVHLEA